MSPLVASVTHAAAFLTVLADVFIVAAFALMFRDRYGDGRFLSFLRSHGLRAAFAVSLSAIAGSLFYSEVAGFAPCVLCVVQRILMYPQAVFLGAGIWRRRRIWADASLVFSLAGAGVAAYNQYLQFGGESLIPCGASGASACAQRFFVEFGYVTIPMMSLTAFLLVIALIVPERIHRHRAGS